MLLVVLVVITGTAVWLSAQIRYDFTPQAIFARDKRYWPESRSAAGAAATRRPRAAGRPRGHAPTGRFGSGGTAVAGRCGCLAGRGAWSDRSSGAAVATFTKNKFVWAQRVSIRASHSLCSSWPRGGGSGPVGRRCLPLAGWDHD